MQVYVVGGALRDAILGLAVKDRDYVVVGATPEEMIAQGYRPVGAEIGRASCRERVLRRV